MTAPPAHRLLTLTQEPPAHRLLALTQAAGAVSPIEPDSSDRPPRRLALPTQLPPRWAAIVASHGDADTSWRSFQVATAAADFIQRLEAVKFRIDAQQMGGARPQLSKYLRMPNFTPQRVRGFSTAGLVPWP